MIETNINNSNLVLSQEPKTKIHPRVTSWDVDHLTQHVDGSSESQEKPPKTSFCSLLCANLHSIFKTKASTNQVINAEPISSKQTTINTSTTSEIINKIFLENSLPSANTSCDELSTYQGDVQKENGNNKRKIVPVYCSSNMALNVSKSNPSLSNTNQTHVSTLMPSINETTVEAIVDNDNEKESKDTIDEAIKNLGVKLSDISTNFDSLSIEEIKASESSSASSIELYQRPEVK